jgi:2-aminoethylphosphonate-pyruvate transaminase
MTQQPTALPKPKLGEPYLLTPGPLTTSIDVKEAMLRDWGSWDGDFKEMTAELRKGLISLLGDGSEAYDCVPIQGSGTFAVEAMLGSFTPKTKKNPDPVQWRLRQTRS